MGMQFLKEQTQTESITYASHLTQDRNSLKIFMVK